MSILSLVSIISSIERCTVLHCHRFNFSLKVLGSVGHPIRHTEFKVVDSETGEVLPPGSSGIVKVRGPPVMKGYYKVSYYYQNDLFNFELLKDMLKGFSHSIYINSIPLN